MIYRMWHGWTSPDNADAYQEVLLGKLMPDLMARSEDAPRDTVVLRRLSGTTFEFVTVMTFDDLAAVRTYAGEDYERAVVPTPAQQLLQEWDDRSAHYEVVARFTPDPPAG